MTMGRRNNKIKSILKPDANKKFQKNDGYLQINWKKKSDYKHYKKKKKERKLQLCVATASSFLLLN